MKKHSLLAMVLLPFFLAFASPAVAQEAKEKAVVEKVEPNKTEAEKPELEEALPADEEVPSTIEQIADQATKAYKDWKTLGWMYGAIAIIGLLMLLLRFKPVNALLEKKDWKKYKPAISAVLGALTSFFVAWAESGFWPQAIIALAMGAALGLGAVGTHQVFTQGNTK